MTKTSLNQRIFEAIRPPHRSGATGAARQAESAAVAEQSATGDSESRSWWRAKQDPAAFGALYGYVDRIYAYIYHRVGNVQDAEDLTAHLLPGAGSPPRRTKMRAALCGMAVSYCAQRDGELASGRQPPPFLSLDRLWSHSHDDDSPESQVEQEETHARWAAAIRKLLPGSPQFAAA